MKTPDVEVEVEEYAMTIHVGICAAGEGLQLIAMSYGDKEFWRGNLEDKAVFAVDKPELYGGIKKEGGVKGLLWWLPGDEDQVMPESLAGKMGLTSATCPGFRGLASVFFTGIRGISEIIPSAIALIKEPARETKGFYWAANNPYLRPIAARIRRPSIGLDPDLAMIRMPDDSNGNEVYASNPAHMIYECLVNTDWGMGESPNAIDKATFEAGAQTFWDEQFGLSMIWTRSSEIGSFIGEILTHVRAALFVHPATGKHTLKALRADYDVETLAVIDPSNARLSAFRRKAWGEISNEVVVTWTNPESGKEETVVAQDLAAIAAEGAVISSSQNYYGIPSQALAIKVADRDLASSVSPIATCEATVTRAFWDTVSSDVVLLNWPEYNIDQIVFRVSQVELTDNYVSLSLYEDIFGLDLASYLTPGGSQWENPSQEPSPATYYRIGTMPAFLTYRALGIEAADLAYPEVLSFITVAPDSDDDVNYDIVTYVSDINGTVSQASLGTYPYSGTWLLEDGLVAEAETTLTALPGLRGAVPATGDIILISTETDDYCEIASVQSSDDTGYVLNRGMFDTVPRAWADNTRAFVLPGAIPTEDRTARAITESVSYWFLTRTTLGTLPIEDAPVVNVTLSNRPYRPNRPANVKVNGTGFGIVDATAAGNLTITWANRNRLEEVEQALKWTDASIAGEVGKTSRVVISQLGGTPIVSYSGLSGTSHVVAKSALSGHSSVRVSVEAVRDGITSLQSMSIVVNL